MNACIFKALCALALLVASHAEDNLQRWSILTKMDAKVTLKCKDDFNKTQAQTNDRLVWRKHGMDSPIINGGAYTLSGESGINDMFLSFMATESTNGIYFCEVFDINLPAIPADDELRGIIVKGVNVGVHEYKDFLDRYEEDLIVGAIAGGSVLFLIVSFGLISHYRYKSPEELEELHELKARRLRSHQQESGTNGYDNKGMDESPDKNEHVINYPRLDQADDMNTTF